MKVERFLSLSTLVPLAVAQSVTFSNGTVVGSQAAGIDTFRGIPYAQQPTGIARLKAPQILTVPFGTIQATGTPKACPQFQTRVDTDSLAGQTLALLNENPLAQAAANQGEDCLTLDVQRPTGTTQGSNLPVLVWIYGGGFESGATNQYDASTFIRNSVALNNPFLFVQMNYRVGGFGFLAGAQLEVGNTNLGLRDQRLAMQWVQDNIAAFGGDPNQVTIFGESAGSISVFDHLIINGGDNTYKGRPLFRAAIMDSGTLIPSQPVSSPKAQDIFNRVVNAAGCNGPNPVACLRSLPFNSYLNAANSVPSAFDYSSLNLSYLPRPDPRDNFFPQSPELAIRAGAYARVPLITGDQEDEGTLFSLVQANITTNAQIIEYFRSWFGVTTQAMADFTNTYPEDITAGSPFRTGLLNNIYPQYKRIAAILGDLVFTLPRRIFLSAVADTVPCWSYFATYLYGTPVLGTLHGSDPIEIFMNAPNAEVSVRIQTYYISFIKFLDPNRIRTASTVVNWPRYDTTSRSLLNFGTLGNSITADTFRNESYNALVRHGSDYRG